MAKKQKEEIVEQQTDVSDILGQYLKENKCPNGKINPGTKLRENPTDLSPNIRHTHGMSDEGDFSRIIDSLKICEIFTPI